MNKETIYSMPDLEWSGEDRLQELGIDTSEFQGKRRLVSRMAGDKVEYLNATVKAYLAREEIIDRGMISPGIVDIFGLSRALSEQDPRKNHLRLLETIDENPGLLGTAEISGVRYSGIPLKNVYRVSFLAENHQEETDKNAASLSLESILNRKNLTRGRMPNIAIKNGSSDPFFTLAYILANYRNEELHELAGISGEDPVKVELLLYKCGKLILPYRKVAGKLRQLYSRHTVEQKRSSSGFDPNDVLPLSQYMKLSGMDYDDILSLINHGFLESVMSLDDKGNPVRKISARSVLYHCSRMLNGDGRYKNSVSKALSSPAPKLPRSDISVKHLPSKTSIQKHIKEIKRIRFPNKQEEIEICKRIGDAKQGIEALVSTTSLMKDRLAGIYRLARDRNHRFYDNVSKWKLHSLEESGDVDLGFLRNEYMEKIGKIMELFAEAENRRNLGKRDGRSIKWLDRKISDIFRSMEVEYSVTSSVALELQNILWDMRILEKEISSQNCLIDSIKNDGEGTTPSARKHEAAQKRRISDAEKQMDSLEKLADMSYDELDSTVKKILAYEKVIETSKNELIVRNLRLVMKLAHFNEVDYSWAVEGGIKGINMFEYRRGYKLSTYVTYWILQSIDRGKKDTGQTIRKPVHVLETINKCRRFERYFIQEYDRLPTDEEFLEAYNKTAKRPLTLKKLLKLKQISLDTISLDEPVAYNLKNEDSDKTRVDFISYDNWEDDTPEAAAFQSDKKNMFNKVLATLTPQEEKVLRRRFGMLTGDDYGDSETLEEVGADFRVTRERIRQIEAQALRKMRHPIRSKKLKQLI